MYINNIIVDKAKKGGDLPFQLFKSYVIFKTGRSVQQDNNGSNDYEFW